MLPFPLPRIFAPISCDDAAGSTASPTSTALGGIASLKQAVQTPESELKRWRKTFEANAKVSVGNEKFLDRDSFVHAIAPKDDISKLGRAQFSVLFKVADGSKRGMVSWDDFAVFQTLLKRPDADYWIAFKYFDVDSSGTITFNEFKHVYSTNMGPDCIPFNFDCDWVKLYLGKKDGAHVLGYNEFTQLMKGLQGERLRQAFKYLDDNQDGFIRPDQFKRIILELAGHKLNNAVIERLPTLCTLTPGGKISYSEVIAFHNVIREMDMVERVIREATRKSKDGRIDQSDFLNYTASSTRYSLFTPMEASIIFHFAGRGDGSQRLALVDFAQLLDPRWKVPNDAAEVKAKPVTSTAASFLSGFAKSAYSFIQGGFAGACGATIVYPIDLVKTRMQNQRSTVVGELLYKNSLDCVQKVLRNEGFLGFYRGLGPQLIGVAPEKAIKLVVNDLIRGIGTDPETGRIKLGWELAAGGTAGGCQVIFTNPLEIVKIRLQVAGEAAKAEGAVPRGAVHIVRQLGLVGLYKGASACLLRDIPFSAIYFTAYNHMKRDVYQEGYNGKKLSFMETLTSAGVAGMPAAYLTTPADVVKTRLQVEAKKGETHYKGLADAFVKIYREEGFKALFKGGPARVLRSSPQFGFTLVAYEYLHKFLPFPWEERPKQVETAFTSGPEDLAKVRARNALKILLDVHGDVGQESASSS
ncbi:mitochondrial carrier [Phellopilus nigrolimitatus]|nr:mitochondrial carrier [Phellopilus nigrolimitatus]